MHIAHKVFCSLKRCNIDNYIFLTSLGEATIKSLKLPTCPETGGEVEVRVKYFDWRDFSRSFSIYMHIKSFFLVWGGEFRAY